MGGGELLALLFTEIKGNLWAEKEKKYMNNAARMKKICEGTAETDITATDCHTTRLKKINLNYAKQHFSK